MIFDYIEGTKPGDRLQDGVYIEHPQIMKGAIDGEEKVTQVVQNPVNDEKGWRVRPELSKVTIDRNSFLLSASAVQPISLAAMGQSCCPLLSSRSIGSSQR